MEGKVQVLKGLKEKLGGYVQDRDVFLFEQIRKYQKESFIFDVLKIVSQDKECTAHLWEVIADICFEKLGSYEKIDDDKRIQAMDILSAYRHFLQKNAVQLTNQEAEKIPDDILVFDRNERNRMESKLHNELFGIDLKMARCRDEDELRLAEKEAITLVSMIKKRIEQIEQSKVKMICHKKIFRDSSKKQMIKLSVLRYEKIKRDGMDFEDSRVVFTETLPFKQSDKKTIAAVNEIITKINEEFNLQQPLY